MEVHQQLERISDNLNKLLISYNQLKVENKKLREENLNFKTSNKEQITQISELKNKIDVLQLSKGVGLGEKEKKELKKKLDRYIKEIDKCIAKIEL